MCLIVVAVDVHPDFPLVLVANRDEFYARPTLPLHFWAETPELLAGMDVQHGGTWAGWHRKGRFAALTNIRRPQALTPGKRSRGELPLRYLQQEEHASAFARSLQGVKEEFAPFNLLVGGRDGLSFLSSDAEEAQPLAAGVHGLSNAALNTPWPKVEHARARLAEALDTPGPLAFGRLFGCLERTLPFPDDDLPDTGVGLAWERRLSPPFIVSEDYGTRSTIALLARPEGEVILAERWYPDALGPRVFRQRTYVLMS